MGKDEDSMSKNDKTYAVVLNVAHPDGAYVLYIRSPDEWERYKHLSELLGQALSRRAARECGFAVKQGGA